MHSGVEETQFSCEKNAPFLGQVSWMGAVVFAVLRNALRQTYILDDIG